MKYSNRGEKKSKLSYSPNETQKSKLFEPAASSQLPMKRAEAIYSADQANAASSTAGRSLSHATQLWHLRRERLCPKEIKSQQYKDVWPALPSDQPVPKHGPWACDEDLHTGTQRVPTTPTR